MYTALLTAIVLWISANFDFPANYEHPNIKLVPASEITFLRYRAFTAIPAGDHHRDGGLCGTDLSAELMGQICPAS